MSNKKKIIYIEDEEDVRNAVKFILENENYTFYGAANGPEGIAKIANYDIDLLLLDIMMPGMDGFEVCKAIKEGDNIDLPVIFISAKAEPEDIAKGFSLGADDYIIKPFDPEDFIDRIKKVLNKYSTHWSMKAVIQRVKKASVVVAGKEVSAIAEGILVLLGIAVDDTEEDSIYLANKIFNLRIFEDENGKLNYSLENILGEILVVPQFTLLGDCSKGRRPNFNMAAAPQLGFKLFQHFCQIIQDHKILIKKGVFRENMLVNLANNGPVTFILDSKHA